MKTIFKVGMKVYDQLLYPDTEGIVTDTNFIPKKSPFDEEEDYEEGYEHPYPIEVDFKGEQALYKNNGVCLMDFPTLSTKPYKIEFQGFEQKAPAPEFHEALSWLDNNENYQTVFEDERTYPSKEIYKAFEGLRKLIILRDYYNEGWQPDWKDTGDKYCIQVYKGELNFIEYSFTFETLHFKTREIRERFFKEQKELLEIAKPLL